MTARFDPFEPCLALWHQMSRADQCRMIDEAMVSLGHSAPIPELESIREAADDWAALMPGEHRKIYFAAIYATLTEADREGARKFMESEKQKKGSAG